MTNPGFGRTEGIQSNTKIARNYTTVGE